DDRRDVVQWEIQLAVEQDLSKPDQVGIVVEPVAGGRPGRRAQQADLVVVVQRPHRHAREVGQLSYGPHRLLLGWAGPLCALTSRQGQVQSATRSELRMRRPRWLHGRNTNGPSR